ncbi:MAG TPA: amylo-alpha-1,6-glucosidase [Spirochaetota bacterium]|nr:amylo-alpha-1,6-glucosidase [Spirochaetota bacterium]
MISLSKLRLTADKNKRFIQSDNLYTYFSVSDFNNEFDGLYFNGFKIFDSVYISNKIVKNKINSIISIDIHYSNGDILDCSLFRKNNGFLVELKNKNVLPSFKKKWNFNFEISSAFEVLEKNSKFILLEYSNPVREGFGFDKAFCIFSVPYEYSIDKSEIKDKSLSITLINSKKTEDPPEIYLLYHTDVDRLKSLFNSNILKLNILKKQHIKNSILSLRFSNFETENNEFNIALSHAILSGQTFVMHKNDNIGIWAGYPWFDNNWGRDTFISLPGISLVTGRYEEALHIIETFIKRQCLNKKSPNYGKIPNVIFREDNILYNTADATPLFIREIYEYFLYTGDYNSILSLLNSILIAIDGVYIKNKDKNNFYLHNDSDDWMDAKKDGKYPYSPRGDKAIEIEVLWYTALYCVINIIDYVVEFYNNRFPTYSKNLSVNDLVSKKISYKLEAEKLKNSILKYFFSENPPYLYDHLNKDMTPGTKIRPNVFLAIHYSMLPGIPSLFSKEFILKVFKYFTPKLVYKHGVSSLSKDDEDFHPIHISDKYHKDAAYHNGAIWQWLSGSFIKCGVNLGFKDFVFEHLNNLSHQILHVGAIGTLSELADPFLVNNEVNPSGTYSQAWSVAEFCRIFYQDIIGIYPNVPERILYITPFIPKKLGTVKVIVRYGFYETLSIYVRVNKATSTPSYIEVKAIEIKKPVKIIITANLATDYQKSLINFKFSKFHFILNKKNDNIRINFDTIFNEKRARISDISMGQVADFNEFITFNESIEDRISEELKYSDDIKDIKIFNCMKEENYLDRKIFGIK